MADAGHGADALLVPSLIGSSGETLREAFGKALTGVAAAYPSLVVLDADVAGGTGMHHFRRAYPDRFVQLGIAEQNMVGVAAGMALAGRLVVAGTFAVFALRAVEQLRQSIACPRLNVKLAARHPGHDRRLAGRRVRDGESRSRDPRLQRPRVSAYRPQSGPPNPGRLVRLRARPRPRRPRRRRRHDRGVRSRG